MKLIEKIRGQFSGLGDSFLRFPVTAILSFTLMGLLIVQNERNIQGIYETETLRRLAMVTAIGMLLSISLKHLQERFWPDKPALLITALPALAVMVLYYLFYTEEMNMTSAMRFVGTLLILIIAIFYTLKLKHKENYEHYVVRVFNGLFITILYSGVLYFGISAIIFTINALFDAEIDGKWFFYFFLMVTFVFGALMFLSKLPREGETFEEQLYSKALKVLLLYIVIPLITIYTGILYVYFIKILVTQEWPRGLVSNLVLWYSVVSAAVIFFITPILHENQVARLFRTWFPRILLPILAMMFVSIGKRIAQYGVTENRYLVVLLGVWVLAAMLYFIIRKELNNIFLPVSLSVFALIAVFGPLSAFSVSDFSQNQRFTALLEKNSMLVSGEVVPGTEVSEEDRKNISSIVSYYESRDMDKISYLDDDFEYSDFERTFGFQREDYYGSPDMEYINLFTDQNESASEVSGFDYLFMLNNYTESVTFQEMKVELNDMTSLKITLKDELILEENLNDEILAIIEEHQGQMEKGMLSQEDAIILLENEKISVKVMLLELSARRESGDELKFDHLRISLLIDVK